MGKEVRIAHLYPEQLNLYGDKGNIITLTKRLEWRGIEYSVENIKIAEHNKKLSEFDLFFIGGGQDSQQFTVAKDLQIRRNEIQDLVEHDVPFLAVCGGYQLLGKSYQTSEGDEIEGLGILDVVTKAKPQEQNKKQDRLIGNVYAELLMDFNIDTEIKTLVGFENHSGRTYILNSNKQCLSKKLPDARLARSEEAELTSVNERLKDECNAADGTLWTGTKPFAKIVKGFGNNAEDEFEGAIYKNIIGTYVHGSLLPKNPHLADEIIWRTLSKMNHPYLKQFPKLEKLNDKLETAAHSMAASLQ